MKAKIPKTPNGFQAAARKFWKRAHSEVEFTEAHDLERLAMACRCLDEIAQDEKTVAEQGRLIEDRFHQVREHPAAKAIRDNKVLFCRIIRELALDITIPEDSRPPRQYGG